MTITIIQPKTPVRVTLGSLGLWSFAHPDLPWGDGGYTTKAALVNGIKLAWRATPVRPVEIVWPDGESQTVESLVGAA